MKKSLSLANLPVIISALKCELEDPRLNSLIEKPLLKLESAGTTSTADVSTDATSPKSYKEVLLG
jgi:hypothetical protein